MPDLYDDDDELMDLLDSGGKAPALDLSVLSAPEAETDEGSQLAPNDLSALLEEAIAKAGGKNQHDGGFVPAGEQSGMDADVLSSLIAESPDRLAPKDTAGIVMASDNGQQSPFGVKDQRQDLTGNASRVAELYGQMEPEQQAGPGRHEQELNASWGDSDAEIQKAMRAAAIMKALFDDDGGYGERAKYLIEREKERASRLGSARAADAAEAAQNRRVDQATAEMLVLAGVSPEAAVKARMGDPIVQLVRSTGGLGVKLRNQDTQVLNKNVGETGDVWQTLTEEEGKDARQERGLANKIEVAKLGKRPAKGGGKGAGGGDNKALVSAFLQRNENVTPATADAFVAGTLDPSDPSYAKLNTAMVIFNGMGSDKQAQLLKGTLGREGSDEDKLGIKQALQAGDLEKKRKARDELDATGRPLQRALKGWQSLPPKVKAWAVRTGLEGMAGELKQLGFTDEQAVAFSRIIKQVNEDIKRTAGAAVSNSEWVRKGAEIGITGNGVSVKSPAIMEAWLNDGWSDWKARKRSAEEVYGPLWGSGAQ